MVGIYTELLLSRYVPDDPTAKQYGVFIKEGVQRMEKLIRDLLTYSRVIYTDGRVRENRGPQRIIPSGTSHAGEPNRRDRGESDCSAAAARSSGLGATDACISEPDLELFEVPRCPASVRDSRFRGATERRLGSSRSKDNGIGLSISMRSRYSDFSRGCIRRSMRAQASGLAICQRIVERYGGRIWADGRPGKGATFRFSARDFGVNFQGSPG